MKRTKRIWISIGILFLWVGFDLVRPVQSHLKEFDPEIVAKLDQEMWRAYYEKKPIQLFFQLSKLMRKQFRAPYWRSQYIAYQAAKAAFVFKRGNDRTEYTKALPALQRYYSSIQNMSSSWFSVEEAAALELEWWIVHRQRAQSRVGDLEKALMESVAVLYQLLPADFETYAHLRSSAMTLRDKEAEKDGVSEEEWNQIKLILNQSWLALHQAVNNP